MTFRPDFRQIRCLLLAGSLALAGCSEAQPTKPLLNTAVEALAKGDGFGAEVALRQLLEGGAAREDIAAYMGQAELLQGQPVEARKWLAEGAFSDLTAGRGFHMLGRLEMREGNLPAAGQAFDRALQFAPENPRLWVDIGRLRYLGGEQTLAVEAAAKAVELGPKDWEALMFRGQLARDAEGMIAALPWFERALEAKPDQLELLAEYAATLGEAGEATEMLAAVRRITEINPGYLRAYYLQAVIAARAGKYDLARKLLVRSGDIVNDSPAGMLLSGIIDLETGNYASASQQFDKLFRQQPENRRVRELLARSLSLSGSHRELVYRLGEDAKLTSASPYLQMLVARAHEALGSREEASILIDLAAERQSGNLVAIRPTGPYDPRVSDTIQNGPDTLAQVRTKIVSGQRGSAMQVAENFLKRFPGSADALSLAGDAQLAGKQVSNALTYYEQSASIRQSWALARRRAVALRAAGRVSDSSQLLESYLVGHENAVEPAMLLARTQYDRGNLPRAATLLDHALLIGGDRDPELLALRAIIALRMDQPELAERIARRALDIQPNHPASLQAMAMIKGGALSKLLLAKSEKLGRSIQLARR